MPIEKIVVEEDRAWALWIIQEDEVMLRKEINSFDTISLTLTNPQKRLEWLAGRAATKAVMKALDLEFLGIFKDAFGKPFARGHSIHVSMSHSFPYAAVLVDKNRPVGIDLEQPKEKLLRVAPRIHHANELRDLGTDLVKHCIYWCAKESLIKLHGRKDLVFAENMFIEPFQMQQEGDINGQIIFKGKKSVIPLHYIIYTNFVVVFTREK